MKSKWMSAMKTCLSGVVILWAFVDGGNAAISITKHHFIVAITVATIALFLAGAVIWRDYWIQALNKSLDEHKDLSDKLIEKQTNELVVLRHVALCASAIETAVELNIKPNMESLKHYLDAYERMQAEDHKPD